MTSGQCSPVRPSCLVSKRLLLYGKPSLTANPRALIGSFSVRISQYRPFPWKRSNLCIFVLERTRQIHNLQPKQRKKLPEEAEKIEIFPKFQSWMKKMNIFKCKPPAVHFTIRNRVPYNKLLTNLAFSGQYSPVQPSC